VKRVFPFLLAVAVAVAALGGFLVLRPAKAPDALHEDRSFDGNSDQLKLTAFVPTLDTPIPDGQSAVWCASFQLAWDKLKSGVVKGPVEITNAKEVCERLNKAAPVAGDLPDGAYFAAAGWAEGGILTTIRNGMSRQFPEVSVSELDDFRDGILAFAYFEAKIAYGHPYKVNPKQLLFAETGKHGRPVGSFGIPLEGEFDVPNGTRDQGGVLFAEYDEHHMDLKAFAIDLDRHSQPNQVVLARIARKVTLEETFAEVKSKVEQTAREKLQRWEAVLGPNDTLLVPDMHWKVRHQFRELSGPDKVLLVNGRKLPIERAEQRVDFRLDSLGAGVASKAEVRVKAGPRHFHFDRPFLLYLKKRDADRPFFVMWVENAELLSGSGS
jgi:hypothetical protein